MKDSAGSVWTLDITTDVERRTLEPHGTVDQVPDAAAPIPDCLTAPNAETPTRERGYPGKPAVIVSTPAHATAYR